MLQRCETSASRFFSRPCPRSHLEQDGRLTGMMMYGKEGEEDEPFDIDMLVFAVGNTPRDELAKDTPGLVTRKKGGGFHRRFHAQDFASQRLRPSASAPPSRSRRLV